MMIKLSKILKLMFILVPLWLAFVHPTFAQTPISCGQVTINDIATHTLAITSGFEFTLDTLGNRTQLKRYQPLNLPTFNLANSSYSYNSDNQLISATGQSFAYDNNGNLLSRTNAGVTANLTYNYDNQLTQYVSGTTNLSYLYDALGSRIKKTSGSVVTKYIVDPNRMLPSVLAETNASGTITAYYVYGLGVISKIVGSSAYFYQYDGLGSTVAVTNVSGTVLNKYAYDDFGNLATNSTETVANPFKYVGRFGVMTDAPDLLYMRARYYSPSVGRFINKDPIGGTNRYSYVDNDPISWIDPTGNIAIADDLIIGGTIVTGYVIATTDWQAVGEAIQDAVNYIIGKTQSGICKFSRSKKGPLWNAPGMPGDNLRRYEQEQPGAFKSPPKFGKGNWWKKIIWALGQIAQAFHKD